MTIDLDRLADMLDRHAATVASAVREPLTETVGAMVAAGFAEKEIDAFLAVKVDQIGTEMVKASAFIRASVAPRIVVVNDNGAGA